MGGPFSLKSKRSSPYFINVGDCNRGEAIKRLGEAYASAIMNQGLAERFDTVFGPAYKGIPLSVATAIALVKYGADVGYCFDRKEAKTHGEATTADRKKEMIVGFLENGYSVLEIDDVFTTGQTKYDARVVLDSCADGLKYPGLFIAVDRQELDTFGNNAIAQFTEKTGTPVYSTITASDIVDYLTEKGDLKNVDAMKGYLRAWSTNEVRGKYGLFDGDLFEGRRVIPACDVSIDIFEKIVSETHDMDGIGGYKIPASSGRKGWEKWVKTARKYTDKPLLYDHQKAGTDIPDTGRDFMKELKGAGFDAVILFPQSGPCTQVAWTGEAVQQGLTVIVGGEMTHPGYLAGSGGYIRDDAPDEIYRRAVAQGVRHFVVPGNKPEQVEHYRELILSCGAQDPILVAPGFIAQGGSISDAGRAAGEKFGAIVGRGIYEADDIRKAAEELTSQL